MKALELRQEGRMPASLAQSLHALAVLGAAKQSPERAARLFGAVEASQTILYQCDLPIWRAERERGVEAVRAQLEEAELARLWAEGEAMTLEQAVAYALADPVE